MTYIAFNEKAQFEDTRSKELFQLMFKVNVEGDHRLNERQKKMLLYLLETMRNSPIISSVSITDLCKSMGYKGKGYYYAQHVEKCIGVGYLDILIKGKAGGDVQKTIYSLCPIPHEWDNTELLRLLSCVQL